MRILLVLSSLLFSTYSFAFKQHLPTPENTISEIVDYSEPINLLVELKSPSIIELKNRKLFSAQTLSQIKNEQEATKDSLMNLGEISVLREFQFVFNGLEIKAHQHKIKDILNISTVKRVVKSEDIFIPSPVEDGDFDTLLNESVALIGARALHSQNIRGAGRIIAILDTGIDLNHPAFSKPGKILATFNAMTGGTDVKDGHGHGTHVAGISAGNGGEIIGVAPDAKLVVIKVLSDQGTGSAGNIIEGMEHVADLDKDPTTFDPVDVANLSLGTSSAGDPTDPMAQAVDRLSDYGVIFAIAAGNNGYSGISSPGVAEKAITVGASTKSDSIAQFSSVGPVEKNNFLKPEIVAPGVNIKSSFPNNEYKRWSGTSMAAPHVAGAVALLRELHPDWRLNDIKRALMASAKDIQGASSLAQGWGRIQLDKAVKMEFSLSNPFIYLGTFFNANGITDISNVLEYINHTEAVQKVKMRPKRVIPGITISLQDEIEVLPKSTINIPVAISVDESVLSFPEGERMFYEPNIELEIDGLIINFPLYLLRGIPITIKKDVGNLSIYKLGSTFRKIFIANGSPEISLALAPGEYIFTFDGYPFGYKDFYYIRKDFDVSISSAREINLNPEEAIYKISIDHRDLSGERCRDLHPTMGTYQKWTGERYQFSSSSTIGLFPAISTIHLSDGDYKFSFSSRCISGKEFSLVSRSPGYVVKDEIIGTPSQMVPVKLNVAPFLKDPKFWISDMQCHFFGCLGSLMNPGTLTNFETLWFDGNEMNLRFYVVKDKKRVYDSLSFYVDKNSVGHFGFLSNFYRSVPLKEFNFGYPPLTWQGVFENRSDTIRFRNTNYLMNPLIFFDSSGLLFSDSNDGDGVNYELKRENGVIENGIAHYAVDSDNVVAYLIPTSPGKQEVTIFGPMINGEYGPVEFFVKTNMDPGAQDPNPPIIRNLEIISGGSPSYEIDRNDIATIQFESGDYEARSNLNVSVSTKPTAGLNWLNIQASHNGSVYSSLWQPTESGLYDLKIEAIDENGNVTEVNQVGGIYVN